MNKRDLETVLEEVRNIRSNRKGCDYCLKTNPEYAGCSNIWHDNKLSIGYGNYIEINFCPMCGRYLRKSTTQRLKPWA